MHTKDTQIKQLRDALNAMWKFASDMVEKHGLSGDETMDEDDHAEWQAAAALANITVSAGNETNSVDQVDVEHWNAPRYGGSAHEHDGNTFTFDVSDQRATSGQLFVSICDDNGEIDDVLSAAFEITTPIGSNAAAAALMIYEGDEVVVKVFRQPNGHLIEPTKPSARIVPTRMPNGEQAWMLLDR